MWSEVHQCDSQQHLRCPPPPVRRQTPEHPPFIAKMAAVRLCCSGFWCSADLQVDTNVSEKDPASILRAEVETTHSSGTLLSNLRTCPHDVKTQQKNIDILTVVRTSKVTWLCPPAAPTKAAIFFRVHSYPLQGSHSYISPCEHPLSTSTNRPFTHLIHRFPLSDFCIFVRNMFPS
jgi:hypothetical protein